MKWTLRPSRKESREVWKQEWRRPSKDFGSAASATRGAGHLSTQAVNWAAREMTHNLYSRLFVEERHLVQDGEELTLRDTQASINGLCIWNTNKPGLFPQVLEIFKEYGINSFQSSVLYYSCWIPRGSYSWVMKCIHEVSLCIEWVISNFVVVWCSIYRYGGRVKCSKCCAANGFCFWLSWA